MDQFFFSKIPYIFLDLSRDRIKGQQSKNTFLTPTKTLLWGQRICGSGPLYIRAQGLSRGDIVKVQKRPKDMAVDDLMLGTP